MGHGQRRWMRDKYDPPSFDFDPDLDDREALARAMAEVRPIKIRRRCVKRGRNGRTFGEPAASDPSAPLIEFMSSPGFDWSFTPDYIEGGSLQCNPLLAERLRRGDFSVQAELDLHGLSRKQAHQALEEFLHSCLRRGMSCVRVIHGTGRHSPSRRPVLKQSLQSWFEQRRLGRFVVAYASARPADGGLGAVYVLLASKGRLGH